MSADLLLVWSVMVVDVCVRQVLESFEQLGASVRKSGCDRWIFALGLRPNVLKVACLVLDLVYNRRTNPCRVSDFSGRFYSMDVPTCYCGVFAHVFGAIKSIDCEVAPTRQPTTWCTIWSTARHSLRRMIHE